MRLSQPASASSSKGGKHNRLGVKRKKHKKLDAICDSALNQNRRIKFEPNEKNGRAGAVGDDSELRRSSRAKRAPVILDVSPPPPKKRRKKFDMNGNRNFGGSGGRGAGEAQLGKSCSASTPCSNSKSSEEGTAGWKSRLRSRAGTSNNRAMSKASSPHGKRKLFKDLYEIEDEVNVVKDDLSDMEGSIDGSKSADIEGQKGNFEEIVEKSDEEGTLLTSCMDDTDKEEPVDDGASQGVDKECEVASICLEDKLFFHSDANEEEQVDHCDSLAFEKDIEVGADLEENLISNEEEQIDCSTSKVVENENENEVGTEKLLNADVDKFIVNDDVEASEHNVNVSEPAEFVKAGLEEIENTEVFSLPNDMKDGEHIDVKSSSRSLQQEEHSKDKDEKQTGNSCTTYTARHRKSRIKEGRRCGLCGGGTDGKPRKRLIPGSSGSDHEPCSGSSDSEEPEYDLLDGFGEEPGWLGRLLGPISDRYGIAGIWVHQQCAVWSPEVYFAGVGCLKNIRAALCRGRALKCTCCGRPGATTGCRVDRCPRTYHLPCARASRCIFDHRKFLIACTDHRHLFQPHGYHNLQRIKKLKAKKMKLEIRKQSNCALRKDHEAEEKWLEKCGEDEEFLKRETKRLQRDMLRIAPIYVGGSHSEGENLFEGWDSVAGLQDVVRCMKEVVILPLLYPEFFDNMGLTPPRGVLLHGYPGTGKTLVVRSLIGSCARGERRIAYFARKGADCLGKYVGDAERQLRLLFQVAEKCQPSIIFFDEIDGLAPVRSRQQDQTHSSVVSTLLALMDGLKSRGSVIVIGATNRPDAVDPALRRPGRFDREIYFPLPKVEDRASILALHTRKWPKPLGGHFLQWVAGQTVGFAGADLQALCTQAAMTALKKSCPLQKILLVAGERGFEGKCPQLPPVVVEERDWLEALSRAPPPCSRREAGAAASEITGAPLHSYLVPCLLQPLSSMIVPLYLDQRISLPPPLFKAGETIKSVIVSALKKKNLFADDWWCHVGTMAKESETAYKIAANLSSIGILAGDATCAMNGMSNEVHDDVNATLGPDSHDSSYYGLGNICYGRKEVGYRMLIAGNPRSGQRHLASCLLHCFVGNTEIHKIDMATISQEGHGDVLQGITQILMRCASLKSCVLFLPRIDLWAMESCCEVMEESLSENPRSVSDKVDIKRGLPLPTSDSEGVIDTKVVQCASQTWNCFTQQVEALDVSSSLIIMATSDMPDPALSPEVRRFFGSGKSTSNGLVSSRHTVSRIAIDLDGNVNHEMKMHSFASELARDLVKQFIQIIYHQAHSHQDPPMLYKGQEENQKHMFPPKPNSSATEEHKSGAGPPQDAAQKIDVPRNSRTIKGKSSLMMAINCFGYQILSYPHFAELCWVTSKLKDGPFADVRGPWKGWPFNSCIVRIGSTSDDTGACISSTTKGKEKFSLVRGLLAVGLCAYRGVYTSLSELSTEVRKVLELLVSEISTRVQAGKDRYQYARLLSQAAYFEDTVNNWVHSLRSLELDARTEVTKPKLTEIRSSINNQDCPHDPPQVSVEASGLNTDLLEPETLHTSVDATTTSVSEPAALNKEARDFTGIGMEEAITLNGNVLERDLVQDVDETSINSAETATLNNGGKANDVEELLKTDKQSALPMKLKGSAPLCNNSVVECINHKKDASGNVALAVDPVAVTDIGKADVNQPSRTPSREINGVSSGTYFSNHHRELTVDDSSLDSLKQINGIADLKSCVSGDFGSIDHLGSSETYKQPETSSQVENGEVDPCIGNHANYSPERSNHPSVKPEIMCSYSCCFGCAHTLHQLLQKVVSKELELIGGCSTVEDVHDFVSSLTSSLCLAVRKLCVAGSFAELSNQVSSENCRKVYQSMELDKCKCKMPEIQEIIARECTCHHGESNFVQVDSSAYHQLGITSRFIYKDGVLVSSHPGKDLPFHCTYENFCLCTLIELIVISRQL